MASQMTLSASIAPDTESLCMSVCAMPQRKIPCKACWFVLCTGDAPLFCPTCLHLPCLCALLQKLPVYFPGSFPSYSSACRGSSKGSSVAEGCCCARLGCFTLAIVDTPWCIQPGRYWDKLDTASSSISTSSCFSVAAAKTCNLHNLFASLQQDIFSPQLCKALLGADVL